MKPALQLAPKQKLTIIGISDHMAHTTKLEVEVVSLEPQPKEIRPYANGPVHGYRYGTMKQRGKRKPYYLDVKFDEIVFAGWDHPVKVESEVRGGFSGNACYNLGGVSAEELRRLLETENLNGPLTEDEKASCVHVGVEPDDETLLWARIHTSHAAVQRMQAEAA